MRLARGPMGPGPLQTPAGISLRGGTSRRPLRASGGHALSWYDLGYDLVPFYMVTTGSYPGSKTAALHTAVTAEIRYSGTNDSDANLNYRISLLTRLQARCTGNHRCS